MNFWMYSYCKIKICSIKWAINLSKSKEMLDSHTLESAIWLNCLWKFRYHFSWKQALNWSLVNLAFYGFVILVVLRGVPGRSQSTFTRFVFFWPPTPLRLHFLWYKSLQKVRFFDHLPPSSCKRSLWTAPKMLALYQHKMTRDGKSDQKMSQSCVMDWSKDVKILVFFGVVKFLLAFDFNFVAVLALSKVSRWGTYCFSMQIWGYSRLGPHYTETP